MRIRIQGDVRSINYLSGDTWGRVTVSLNTCGQWFGSFITGAAIGFVLCSAHHGLFLSLLGKELLLKKTPDDNTYWNPAKNSREFDRMF